jgi:hypothetical protein
MAAAHRLILDVAEDQGLFAASDAYCRSPEREVSEHAESEVRRVGKIEQFENGQTPSADKR